MALTCSKRRFWFFQPPFYDPPMYFTELFSSAPKARALEGSPCVLPYLSVPKKNPVSFSPGKFYGFSSKRVSEIFLNETLYFPFKESFLEG